MLFYIHSIIAVIVALVLLIIGFIAKTYKTAFQYTYENERIKEDHILDVEKFNSIQSRKFFISSVIFLSLAVIMFLVAKTIPDYRTMIFLMGILIAAISIFVLFATLDKDLEQVVKQKKKRRNR